MAGPSKTIDYSKWENLQISDDDEDVPPNVDPKAFHNAHNTARMQELEEDKQNIEVERQHVLDLKEKLDEAKKSGLDFSAIEKEYNDQAEKLAQAEEAYIRKEKAMPVDVATVTKEGFSKTVIQSDTPSSSSNESTDSAPASSLSKEEFKKLEKFVDENKDLLEEFVSFSDLRKSAMFLMRNNQLLREYSYSYLMGLCVGFAMEDSFDMVQVISEHTNMLHYLLEMGKYLKVEPCTCIPVFITQYEEDKNMLNKALQECREKIMNRAKERLKAAKAEEEELNRQARLGPGGLDPVEVFQAMPKHLQDAILGNGLDVLQEHLESLPIEEARDFLRRLADAGLWEPFTSAPENEEDTAGAEAADEEGAVGGTEEGAVGEEDDQEGEEEEEEEIFYDECDKENDPKRLQNN